MRKVILLFCLCLLSGFKFNHMADPYWVSPTGAAAWGACQSAVPLADAAACSLGTANTNATAGDLVYLRGGTYSDAIIQPTHSGASGNRLTFEKYTGETPIIKHNLVTNYDMELDSNWSNSGTPTDNSRSSTQAYMGTYSRKFTVDAADEGIKSDTYSVITGVSYDFSGWVWSDQTSVNVYVVNGNGNVLSDTDKAITANTWNWISVFAGTGVTGSNAYIAFRSPTGTAAGTWYVDNVMLCRYDYALTIVGYDYVTVRGITFNEVLAFFWIGYGADNNEIDSCAFDKDTSVYYSAGVITYLNRSSVAGPTSNYNWIHDCTFDHVGRVSSCNDECTALRIGAVGADLSAFNLIEDNVFFHAGHDDIDVGTRFNVIRNNVFHNYESYFKDHWGNCPAGVPNSGYFGNRNIILTSYADSVSNGRNLIEGNRIGHAGLTADQPSPNGIENALPHTVIRYNYIYDNGQCGYENKNQVGLYSDSARIYNNTFYYNGWATDVINLPFAYRQAAFTIACIAGVYTHPTDIIAKNNILRSNKALEIYIGTTCTGALVNTTYLTTDPVFTNTDVSDPTSLVLPDLTIGASSPAINAGSHLTAANGPGTNSTSLTVLDASYFQDGTWAPVGLIDADWIAVGTVGNVAQISGIDYAKNVITLAAPLTWADGAYVWLYKKSDGTRVLYGTAPDIGANEFNDVTNPTVAITTPTPNPVYATHSVMLTIAGNSSDDTGIVSNTWTCDNCLVKSGTATGTTTWSFSATFALGDNTIEVTTHDAFGLTGTDSLVITFTDNTPPVITFTSPTRNETYATSVNSMTLTGIAVDDVAVDTVTWTCDFCLVKSGTATGTTTWSQAFTFDTLGLSSIMITATDSSKNSRNKPLVVTFYSSSGAPNRLRLRRPPL